MPRLTDAHFEARRRQILEATFRCLAEKGYSRMTMREIAAEAGIGVGTLYLYFKSKDEIVRALGDEARVRTDAHLAEQFPDGGPIELLNSIFGSVISGLDEPGQRESFRVDVQVWAEALHHESLRELFRSNLAARIGQVSTLIVAAQKEGSLPEKADPERLARIFMAILMGLELQKAMEPDYAMQSLVDSMRALLGGGSSDDWRSRGSN